MCFISNLCVQQENQQRERQRQEQDREKELEFKRKQRDLVGQGHKPFYLKKCGSLLTYQHQITHIMCYFFIYLIFNFFKTSLQLTWRSWNWQRSTASWKGVENWRTSWVRRGSAMPPRIAKNCPICVKYDASVATCVDYLSWCEMMLGSYFCWTVMFKENLRFKFHKTG